ncbi:MAG: sugar ABC transporter permease [Lachnospiraceae bacterium]|nr:sugar ABC transporter permease [Lachnospiraceae bacterium]
MNGKKQGALIKSLKKCWPLYLMILPAALYVLIYSYGPMYGLQIAFKDYSARKGIWGSDWVGLKHFIRLLKHPNLLGMIKNTLAITLYSFCTFPVTIIFALMLNELRQKKFKKTVQMISYIPHFLSTVVVCSMITLFFHPRFGVINTVITTLGGTAQDFLANPDYFVELFVWSSVWQGVGFGSVIYTAALSSVSTELIEAATIDGANRLQIIWHVNIPHIMPTVVIGLILRCGNLLSVGFEKTFLLQNDLNLSVSQVISTYEYEVGVVGGQFSYSTAIGLLNSIVSVIMITIVNSIAKRVSGSGIW